MINYFILFPLQVTAKDFNMDPTFTPKDLIIAGVILTVIIFVVIINSILKKKGPSGKGSGSGLFSGFALHKIARNIGLNNDQANMLSYVFKLDQVMDHEKSINNPALLDRHFRKAYRIIEHGSASEPENQRRLAVLFSTRNILENSVIGGISSTRQIRDDTPLTISSGKDKINVHVLSTKGDYLVVDSPRNVLGSQIKIQKGTKIPILFFNKSNKGFAFETRVMGYSTYNGHPSMQLAHSVHIKFLSQRRYRRRHSVIACSMYLVYVEGSGKKQRLVVDKRRLQGNIADISVGGCSIKIMAPVQVGARFKIEFIQGDVNVAALGQVLRSNRAGMNTVIHVKFIKIPQKSMNAVNAFVYEYGRE